MANNIVRKPMPEGRQKEPEKNIEDTLDGQETQSFETQGSLDELFHAACDGYREAVTRLFIHYDIMDYQNVTNYLKDDRKLMNLFMLWDITPASRSEDYCQARISCVSKIPDAHLAYLLDLDEDFIKKMSIDEKKELIESLPESHICNDYRPLLMHPASLALSADSEARPLLGAAIKLAMDAGEPFEFNEATDITWEGDLIKTYIPTTYLTQAAKKYGVSNEIYIKSLKALNEAKKRFT